MIRRYILVQIMISSAFAEDGARVEFNRDIRPIFAKHCTACHGGVKEAAGVSFIYRAKALAPAKSGLRPIVPFKPAESELVGRLRSRDPDEVMPKPKHGPPLPEADIALIERWIAQGAEWQDHWSFVAPVDPLAPAVSDEKWPSAPLDRFILNRLDHEKIKPSPEASVGEWLRRVSFDLTGLPPSPEDFANFITAAAKDPMSARAAVVDRLLASPKFGERWASVWLDLARYSDTYGFEKDPRRDIWPYRDWVIRAFNADMPYDQFTIEQLAGDLLPNATADQRLATAFHRNTQTNTEGGTDDEEFRVAAVIDRISTTWTTWQATTFGCVQCHSHPYDPIEHEEFYQFFAFFNGTEDCDQDNDFPRMKVAENPAATDEASRLELQMRIIREQLNQPGHALATTTADWKSFRPDVFAPSHGTLEIAPDGIIRSHGTLPTGNMHKVSGSAIPFTALRLRILTDSDDSKKWPERGSLVSKFEVNEIDQVGAVTRVEMKEVFVDHLGDPMAPEPSGNVGGFPKLEGPRWFVFVPAKAFKPRAGTKLEIRMIQDGETAGQQATPVRQFAIDCSNNPEWSDLVNQSARVAEWKAMGKMDASYQKIRGVKVPVMVDRAPRETRLFARGNRLVKDRVLSPGVPKLLAGSAATQGMNRLDMARWIASRENPLTARVMVNRLWSQLFGSGIVLTTEDFGTSGTPPSHPDLLDHLAVRFEDHFHWSVKSMLREMVLSSTYRQTHKASKALLEKDPSNQLLSRGPRNRLSAEMVRDQALAVAGLLSPKMYGSPVFPPQPDGVWNSVYSESRWVESTGEDRYRRAIYTYSKRTSGYPSMLMFDAPNRDRCSARRVISNTPLQALVTLNDPVFIEAAKGFAKRMVANRGDLAEQIAYGVQLATQQVPTPEMLDDLVSLYNASVMDYESHPAEAVKLAESPAAAAFVIIASTILNIDSALTR